MGRLNDHHPKKRALAILIPPDHGKKRLLVCGENAGDGDWLLLKPVLSMLPVSSREMAAKALGDTVAVDSWVGRVSRIYRATVQSSEGNPAEGWGTGAMLYGFNAVSGTEIILMRWTSNEMNVYQGNRIAPRNVTSHFY